MAAPGAYKVLFAYATDGTNGCYSHVLQNELATEPGIASITTFDASTGTPTVAQLDGYDMVVTISDCDAYWDPATMGDNLAQYAKQGGVVVEYPFGMENSSPYGLTGAWLSASPFQPGNNLDNDVTLGTHSSSSPLMAGVSSLGSSSCDTDPALATGAHSVALWNTGQQAVAYKGQAIAINAGVDGSCTFHGDFARLTLNAVTWRGRHFLKVKRTGKGSGKVTSSPAGITCGKKCSAIYNFGRHVTLTAHVGHHSKFAGWSGACKGHQKTCKVNMTAAKTVKAAFKRRHHS